MFHWLNLTFQISDISPLNAYPTSLLSSPNIVCVKCVQDIFLYPCEIPSMDVNCFVPNIFSSLFLKTRFLCICYLLWDLWQVLHMRIKLCFLQLGVKWSFYDTDKKKYKKICNNNYYALRVVCSFVKEGKNWTFFKSVSTCYLNHQYIGYNPYHQIVFCN